jgi:LacI family transcriptional regulator
VQTMQASGLPVDPAMILDARYDGRLGYRHTMRLMTGAERPTALLAASNVIALGALQACNELSIPCPEEVSLAGIDDVPWSEVIRPRITMAIQPIEDLATNACDLLLGRIAEPRAEGAPVRRVILDPQLKIGDSTRRID